jgi:hypothetical protein
VACCLDLVVTSDTAVAHLAGALGVPTWVALPHAPDWRWLLGREDTPWYPTLRLFRQGAPGDWGGVFARMAETLRGRAASPGGQPAELLDGLAALDAELRAAHEAAREAEGRRAELLRRLSDAGGVAARP